MLLFVLAAMLPTIATLRLTDDASTCAEDKNRLCPPSTRNEFSVLLCLQTELVGNSAAVSDECQQEMWSFKNSIMTSARFIEQIKKQCANQVASHCSGSDEDVIPCMLEHRLDLDATGDGSNCARYLRSMTEIFFSDYHLVKGFLDNCSDDVKKLQCGKITTEISETQSSQAHVISCLELKINAVTAKCRNVLQVKEELAADSFQLDKALYLACRNDRDQLCGDVPDNAGEVYNCLGRFKFNNMMSEQCRTEIVRRQLMSLEDYKIDYGLKATCGEDLVTQHCLEKKMSSRLEEGFMRTVLLLQCLSDSHEAVDPSRVPVSDRCMRKVKQVKRMIMGDIELSPSLGLTCHNDVKTHCSDVSRNKEGGIISCLMELAGKNEKDLEAACLDSVLEFITVVDPISDYQLNYALMENCGDYVSQHCTIEKGEGEVMKCLMELEMRQELRDECHFQVLSYKYFMSRSILLDKPLLNACREDAKSLCKTEFEEVMGRNHKPHGAVISCLYHHLFLDDPAKTVSSKCSPELERTIIAQGESVNLSPNVMSRCTADLVRFCSGYENDKDDYGCLQRHLIDPTDSLEEECAVELDRYTQLVTQDVRNDYRLMKACRSVIHESCKNEYGSDDHSALLGCLVKEKPNLKGSCKQHVKDLQLVSLYDFKFNKQFVDACNADVQKHCRYDANGMTMTKKQDVMYCLREQITKSRDQGRQPAITHECKAQLRAEFMKQMADLDLDPQLLAVCSSDLKTTCKLDTLTDKAQVMECLRKNEKKLTPECAKKVFVREVQQAEDPGIDPVLQKNCGYPISLFCPNSQGEEVTQCLEANLHKSGMTDACAMVVKRRMVKEHSNYKLNIGLKKACKSDIPMLCADVLRKITTGAIKDGEGAVVSCLKDNLDKISVGCEEQVSLLLEQEVADYTLDPLLAKYCEGDIKQICPEAGEDQVEACLRERIMEVRSEDCTKQVVRLITEAHSDVHLDPLLLRACQKDIGYLCGRITPGRGQVIECLQANEQRDKMSLTPTCSHMLKSRVQMWSNAYNRAKQYDSALEMAEDLYAAVQASQNKHEILAYVLLSLGLLIFVAFCGGRCSKGKPPSKLY